MTAGNLLDLVLALMFADAEEKAERTEQFLSVLRLHLLELLPLLASMAAAKGELPPILPPELSLESVLPLDARVLAFLPYGIAGTMLANEDLGAATQYKNKYEIERSGCLVTAFEGVVNHYGTDAV